MVTRGGADRPCERITCLVTCQLVSFSPFFVWLAISLVSKIPLDFTKPCDLCGVRRKDLCSLEGIIDPELGNRLT